MINLRSVMRPCKFCTNGVTDKVPVIPRYTWRVRTEQYIPDGTPCSYIDVTETFLCPCCGRTNEKIYSFDYIPKDILQEMVEREVNR